MSYSRKTFPRTESSKARKQRRSQFNAPKHRMRRMMSCRISDDIGQKTGMFHPRSIPVVKGDVVMVMRGLYKGLRKKVNRVDRKKCKVFVEGAVYAKADGTKIPRPIHSSNLMIVELNLNDSKRVGVIKRARAEFNARFGESTPDGFSEETWGPAPETSEKKGRKESLAETSDEGGVYVEEKEVSENEVEYMGEDIEEENDEDEEKEDKETEEENKEIEEEEKNDEEVE